MVTMVIGPWNVYFLVHNNVPYNNPNLKLFDCENSSDCPLLEIDMDITILYFLITIATQFNHF